MEHKRTGRVFPLCSWLLWSHILGMSSPKVTTHAAKSSAEILTEMVRIIKAHSCDVAQWATLPLTEFFDLLKNGYYNREPDEWRTQVLARPFLSITKRAPIVACANKAIILASWAELNRVPWRLVAAGRAPGRPPHHVYPELFIGGSWRPTDATYPWGVLFYQKPYPVRIVRDGLRRSGAPEEK